MGRKYHNEERSIGERGLRRGDQRSPELFDILVTSSSSEGTSSGAALAHSVLNTNSPIQDERTGTLCMARHLPTKGGIGVQTPVQDALLIGVTADEIEDVVATEEAMATTCYL